MGDAGDLAEVLDEKMWLGDEDVSGEKPEDLKDAGAADQAGQEGDPGTRKMVAGGEESDGDQQYDDDSKDVGTEKKVGVL